MRTERLLDRKQELRRLLAQSPDSLLKYTEYIDGHGTALIERICEMDLEGIIAKQKSAPYITEREHSKFRVTPLPPLSLACRKDNLP